MWNAVVVLGVAVLVGFGPEASAFPRGMPTWLNWNPPPSDVNVQCTSNGGLCDMTFGFGDPAIMMPSSGRMCACPGNVTCPTKMDDPARVYNLELLSTYQKMTLRLGYCQKKLQPKRKCKIGEVVMVTEGESPFALRIVGGLRCRCFTPLVLHSARPDGAYTIQEYSCGKATCNINKSSPPVCERVQPEMTLTGLATSTEVLCQCPDGFTCRKQTTSGGMLGYGRQEMTCEMSNSFNGGMF